MKKALMWVGGVALVLVVGLLAVIAMQPAVSHVERSRVIAASPADVWPYVSDLRGFLKWDPWSKMDPVQTMVFSEASSGVGAWYTWESAITGKGKMTITSVTEHQAVVESLEFFEPFEAKADVTLALAEDAGGTKVTWSYDSPNGFMGKAMGLVMDMDAMLGADFDKGLASLAALAEADATARLEREAAEAAAAAAAATAAAEGEPAAPATP